MCADLESVADSNDPENPPLNFGDTTFLRRQARAEEPAQKIAEVGTFGCVPGFTHRMMNPPSTEFDWPVT